MELHSAGDATIGSMRIDFLITSLIVVVTPGIGVLFTLSAAISRGSRAAAVAAFGCTLGIIPHMVAAILGLAALLQASALAFQTLKYLGVGYLLYLAWATIRESGALSVDQQSPPQRAWKVIQSAILANLLNPETLLVLLRVPASVHRSARPAPDRDHDWTLGGLHVHDSRRLSCLRVARCPRSRPYPVAAEGDGVVSQIFRCGVRRTCRQAGSCGAAVRLRVTNLPVRPVKHAGVGRQLVPRRPAVGRWTLALGWHHLEAGVAAGL